MNGEKAAGTRPSSTQPRPGALAATRSTDRLLLALAVVAAAGLLLVAWAWRRGRPRARGPAARRASCPPRSRTPRGRLVGLSETIRDALTGAVRQLLPGQDDPGALG